VRWLKARTPLKATVFSQPGNLSTNATILSYHCRTGQAKWIADIPVRQPAQQAQTATLFALRAQADRMSAIRSFDTDMIAILGMCR
jgi:hypothetical protein